MVSCEPQMTPYFIFFLAHVISCWWPKCAGNMMCAGCHAGGLGEKQNKAPAHSSHSLITFSWVNGKSVALSLLVSGYGGHTLAEGGVCVWKEGCSCASLKSCLALSIIFLHLTWVKKKAPWCLWYFCDKCYIFLSITYFCWDDWSTTLDNDELFTADQQPFILWYHLP